MSSVLDWNTRIARACFHRVTYLSVAAARLLVSEIGPQSSPPGNLENKKNCSPGLYSSQDSEQHQVTLWLLNLEQKASKVGLYVSFLRKKFFRRIEIRIWQRHLDPMFIAAEFTWMNLEDRRLMKLANRRRMNTAQFRLHEVPKTIAHRSRVDCWLPEAEGRRKWEFFCLRCIKFQMCQVGKF